MANRRPSAKNSMKDLRQEFERVFGIAFLTLPLPEANVTNRSVCPTGLVSEQVATRRSFALILVPLLLVVTSSGPILRAEEVRCRPNIFGGLDCRGPNPLSSSTSRPNIFGGQDIIGPGGRVTTCRPNIFGGADCR